MSDTAKPYVWLQAASDAEMAVHATVIRIEITSSVGATSTCPLITVNNGWTFPHGTKVTLGNVGGTGSVNSVLRGNTFLMSDTPGTGNVSYFGTGKNTNHPNVSDANGGSGSGHLSYRTPIMDDSSNFAFYITDLDGTALGGNATETLEVAGVASVYFEDDDPRKVYGLPYFFVSTDAEHASETIGATYIRRTGSEKTLLPQLATLGEISNLTIDDIYPDFAYSLSSKLIPWPIYSNFATYTNLIKHQKHPLQAGRNLNLTKNIKGIGKKYGAKETLNVRTKWDWIAQHTASASPKTTDQSSGVSVPGYAYGDSTINYRREIANVWRVGKGDGIGSGNYGAEIFTDTPSHLEAGQLFTVTNMNEDVLVGLDVRIKTDPSASVSVVPSVPNNLYFRVKQMVGAFCIRTEAAGSTVDNIVSDPVLGSVWVSQFVVSDSVGTTNEGQVAYDAGADQEANGGNDNHTDISRAGIVAKGYATHSNELMNTPGRIPTTTRFQLHVENITHKFSDQVAVTPMVKSAGTKSAIFEQLQVLGLNVGMRTESIDLAGTLRDTGPVGVDNIRKQVLLNIARTQWLKIMGFWGGKHGSQLEGDPSKDEDHGIFEVNQQESFGYLHSQAKSEEFQSKGKGYGGPTNPRSYACLTIFNPKEQSSTDGKKVDVNPDGGYNIYRGVIKNLGFTQEAGRPDIWQWRMTFEVISNEKLATNLHGPEKD